MIVSVDSGEDIQTPLKQTIIVLYVGKGIVSLVISSPGTKQPGGSAGFFIPEFNFGMTYRLFLGFIVEISESSMHVDGSPAGNRLSVRRL